MWSWDGSRYVPADRTTDPGRWAELVYPGPDEPTITHITDGLATSSLSCQSIVVDMLDSLMVEPGHRVLELGTGAGWNAALLAARAGAGSVTSVEVDAQLAAMARGRLDSVDAGVTVEVGDGAHGRPEGAPYDRLIATYAVDEVPWSWVEQTRPGGRIVTPWGRLGHVALTVAADGRSASGWVQGLAMFMPSRGIGQGLPWHEVRSDNSLKAEGPFPRDLLPLRADLGLLFALRVMLPEVRITTETDWGVTAWLHDTSSWATLVTTADGNVVAYQGGPRRLADEIDQAWQKWQNADAPGLHDFGMTRTPDQQYIWSGDKDTGPRWPTAPQTARI
ncbi:methyltransferase domain-containing protein [Streptomyces scopuliridis]|uniref:Methyltransferase domain-containing protein n=1 Tax=Streptomyces scopuliridis TaxID=452529 RepID=A0ACD4ZKH8_9ACTN|nr:methyltransferase domain-containing protein [Streptomyces scopuliridis]WSB98873.1 methyltransferase domain-containing protein [Streptomyces scopuliridis]WSC07424.1 methyltransferase domain-containing protein [Streptomyces scopuliridis]